MTRESEAERSLRELQEGMQSRSEARGRGPSRSTGGSSSGRARTQAPSLPSRGRPRWWVPLGAAVVIVGGGVAVALLMGSDDATTSEGSRVASFTEANDFQEARGREAQAVVMRLETPGDWTERGDATISMKEDETSGYAFFDTAYDLPVDYSADQFQAWFYEDPSVASLDPEQVSCASSDAGREIACEAVYAEDDALGDSADLTVRQIVTLTYTESSDTSPDPVVAARGYTSAY